MAFDYAKFLLENQLTLGSKLRGQFSEEEETQKEVPAQADPAKEAKLNKLTARKNEILGQYRKGELSLDQYRAKIGNIPQQIQQLRADIDSELNPEQPEEEPADDTQQGSDTGELQDASEEESQDEKDAWDKLQESINILNKKNMSFDYRKFLEENKLTVTSKGKDAFLSETYGMNIVGDKPNIDYTASGKAANSSEKGDSSVMLWKATHALEILLHDKDEILKKYKSGEISLEQYKEEIGDIPEKIKKLQKYIASANDLTNYKRPNTVKL